MFYEWQGSSYCFQMLALSFLLSSVGCSVIRPSLLDGLLSEKLLKSCQFAPSSYLLQLHREAKFLLSENTVLKLGFLHMVTMC